MSGTLTVVDSIQLAVSRNAAGDVTLNWTTGGVGPWNVFRDSSAPMLAPTTLLGMTSLRSHTDPTPTGDNYYLVVEDN